MQFFIAASAFLAVSTCYLLHQYWTRSLAADDESSPPLGSG